MTHCVYSNTGQFAGHANNSLPPMISLLPAIMTVAMGSTVSLFYYNPSFRMWATRALLRTVVAIKRVHKGITKRLTKPCVMKSQDINGCTLLSATDRKGNSIPDCNTFEDVQKIAKTMDIVVTYRLATDDMERPYTIVYSPKYNLRCPPHVVPEWGGMQSVRNGKSFVTDMHILIADLVMNQTIQCDVTDTVRKLAGPLGDFHRRAGLSSGPNFDVLFNSKNGRTYYESVDKVVHAEMIYCDTSGEEHTFKWSSDKSEDDM